MKKTELKRTAPLLRTPAKLKRKARELKRKWLKAKHQRMTPIRASARGELCTICIPGVCNGDPSTTVLCHSNALKDGKGMGLKAPDTAAAYGCAACHDVLDGRRPRPSWLTLDGLLVTFDNAVTLTHRRLKLKGLL